MFGLLGLMIIPAPGIWGAPIGAACVPAIVGSPVMLVLDLTATARLAGRERAGARDWIPRPIGARSGAALAAPRPTGTVR